MNLENDVIEILPWLQRFCNSLKFDINFDFLVETCVSV